MSDVETTDDLVFIIDDSSIKSGFETDSNEKPEPRRAITLARRLAVLLLVVAVGSVIYPRVVGPIVHDRSSEMLEQRLASDLKNGVAPISNPIEPGTPMALVEIPSSNVRAVVVEGSTANELSRAAGHLTGSAIPGQPGVAAILGRSRDFGAEFANLDRVNVGDEIVVSTGQGRHEYEVIDITTRSSNDLAAFKGEGHMLILTTLTGDKDRLVVRASLTSQVFPAGEPASHRTSIEELGLEGDNGSTTSMVWWLVFGAVLAMAWPFVVTRVGTRVAWMLMTPVAMWCAFEVWSALALTAPASR
ncbi:MAG: sortase [Acidimicrobiia bacterium]|nr:sortase [Acidimicrobiia bacterium]